jgi:ABC transporter
VSTTLTEPSWPAAVAAPVLTVAEGPVRGPLGGTLMAITPPATGTTTRVVASLAAWRLASVTVTLKENVPEFAGTPASTPVEALRVIPGGRAPALSVQLKGAVPPLTGMRAPVRSPPRRCRRRLRFPREPLGRLSGGQRAQVALAVALAGRPEMLVLDEPVARLDPLARHEFMGTLMEAVAEEGLSVVFSSHVVSELERVCDYLIVLAGGRLQVSDDVDHLLDSHRVLSGPSDQADQVRDRVPVVWGVTAQRQSRLLVRMCARDTPPEGWRAEPTNLEELVLAYLRSPDVSALDGPQRGGTRPAGVPA